MLHLPTGTRADLILVSAIAIATVKFTFGIDTVIDLSGFDETDYLVQGVELPARGLLKWGGLYSVWYYLLSFVEPDRIQLYYLSYRVLVTATTILFYALLRGLGVCPFFGALASAFYLVSNIPQASPYISLFALFVVLVFLNLTVRLSSDEDFYLAAGLGILLLSFVRPEYTVALVLIFGMSSLVSYRASRSSPRASKSTSAYKPLALLLAGMVSFYLLDNPLKTDRAWEAFGQHFHLHYAEWYGTDNEADWERSRADAFGGARSIVEAAVQNSTLFGRHVLANAGTLPFATMTLPFVTTFPFLSPRIHSLLAWIQLIAFVGAALFVARTAPGIPRPSRPVDFRRYLVVGAIISCPSIISALVVYPRWHYLVVPTTILLTFFWASLSAATSGPSRRTVRARDLALAIVLLVVVPSHANGWWPSLEASLPVTAGLDVEREKRALQSRFYESFPLWSTIAGYWLPRPLAEYEEDQRALENRSVIRFIRSLNIVGQVNFLSGQGYSNYLTDNYVPVHPWEKDDSFARFLQDRQITMILVQEYLLSYPSFVHDREFHDFLDTFEGHGFLERDIPGTRWSLLVKDVLLDRGPQGESIR